MRRLTALSCGLLFAAQAVAEGPDERLRAQLRQTTLELRAAQEQLSSLKAENEALKAVLAAAPARAATADADSRALRSAESRAASAASEAAALRAQVEADKAAITKWEAAYKKAADVARSRDGELRRLSEINASASTYGRDCATRNRELVDIGFALLDAYRNKGVFAALAQGEPLTGLARVKLENAAQDYAGKIADRALPPEPDAGPLEAAPVPPAP